MRSNLGKKALFSAFLFACTFPAAPLRADDCRLPGRPEPAEIAAVLDGDTVRLADNRRVRLLAFGTLEVDHEHPERSAALALEARKTLQYLLPKGSRVQLLTDREKYDVHGRTLAQLLRDDGRDVAEPLLKRGLAHVYIFPPNDTLWRCYARFEQQARAQRLGIWALPEFQSRPVKQLQPGPSLYGVVTGSVTGYRKRGDAITVLLDQRLHVRIAARNAALFQGDFSLPGIGETVTVRGHVNWRGDKAFLDLRHPQALEVISVR
ncbi:MAG TPA: thermonuclease family protein [Permianibacter sp.]|nr:thermonuclease family protein [Permianibacter sp.]